MEEVAEEGATDRGVVVAGVGVINAHHLQTTATHKVSGALAKAAVVGDLFYRPQECSLCRHHLL